VSLRAEIEEQPATLERLLDAGGRRTARSIASTFGRHDVRYAVIAARGTSDNAARYAQYVWGARNRLSVALAAPSLFTASSSPPSLEGAVVVAISQSGRSPDLIAVVEEARFQRRPTIAITNDPGSPLASAADRVLELRAGHERAIAATKTYTAELAAVAMLSAALADDDTMWSALDRAPSHVARSLDASETIRPIAGAFAADDRCVVLGRGEHLSTAFEWALKLQELCGLAALAFSTVDFAHGPVAVVGEGFPVFGVVPAGPLGRQVGADLDRLRVEHGARLVSIGPDDLAPGGPHIAVPTDVEAWLAPIVAIVGAQLFTSHLCAAKGMDPEAPRGLTKVTRTW
jgi:glucosamine--fructose-6-phosphate aminotransferase (isomerizing)